MDSDRHAMMIQADAKAQGMITARSTSQRREPRSTTVALMPCVSIMPDGSRTVFEPSRKSRTFGKRRTDLKAAIAAQSHRITAADLAPIGDVN